MIKYRTTSDKIEVVEVLRETEFQVVLPAKNGGRERRENKRSDWSNWHDSWADAKAFLVEDAEGKVKALRVQLERANGRLGNIKGMKEPT